MREDNSTHTDCKEMPPLTLADIQKVAGLCKPQEWGKTEKYKKSLLEKIMNKFGWHRKYQVYLLDMNRLKFGIEDFDFLDKNRNNPNDNSIRVS
jgi:hypothetical protein